MGHFNKCCCNCTEPYPSFANSTDIKSFLFNYTPDAGATYPERSCAELLPDGALPDQRGDVNILVCGGTSCGTGQGIGPWPMADIAQSYTEGEAHVFDKCAAGGYKHVQSRKAWNGRYDFTTDYYANPKYPTKYKAFTVAVNFSESYSFSAKCYDGTTGELQGSDDGNAANNGNAHSTHTLTPGSVEDCSGDCSVGDGVARWRSVSGYGTVTQDANYWAAFSGCQTASFQSHLLKIPSGDDYSTPEDKDAARAYNEALMKDLCTGNVDRGIISVKIPLRGTYQGPVSGFTDWLAEGNHTTHTADYDSPPIIYFDETETFKFEVVELSLSATTLVIAGKFTYIHELKRWNVPGGGGVGAPIGLLIQDITETDGFNFSLSMGLLAPNTFGENVEIAKNLLGYWDMTDDVVYPWRTDGNCRIAPMVSLRELYGVAPGTGYCDTPADPATAAYYDGSVKGAPQPVKGYYSPGAYDFDYVIYNYFNGGVSCNDTLCYDYGSYMPGYLPTMTTQFTVGAEDTSDCGSGWSPFTRYYQNYVLAYRPQFVDSSCAFVGDGGDAIYAAKWAELKSPIPAQRFYGPCGAQREQTLQDANCDPTATKRWPAAYGICGRAIISSLTRDSGTGVVTVILESNFLVTGDAVDFMDASDAVTTANITVTVDSSTQFHFTGALPTGVSVKSHGAPDPSWYFDNAPKGDFVRVTNFNDGAGVNSRSAEAGNVQRSGSHRAIMVIAPQGSPELTNGAWPAASTAAYSDYPGIQPTEQWQSSINQIMSDRFYTDQDTLQTDGSSHCERNFFNVPKVEARLVAPVGAPYPFTTGDGIFENQMPLPAEFSFLCSGAWNDTLSAAAADSWPGIDPTNASALNNGAVSSDTDAGFGTADATFIL